MPHLSDAVRFAEDLQTTEAELRRACAILGLDAAGDGDALRGRLRGHLAQHDAARPVACLNPGGVAPPLSRPGPRLRRPLASEHAPVFTDELALVPDATDFAAMLRDQVVT